MNKPLIVGGLILLILVAAGFYFFTQPEVVSADMVVEGDYDAPNLALTEGATLQVNGNLLVEKGKTIACADGGLEIHVTGVATIDGTLQCRGEAASIVLVAEGGLVMSKDTKIESEGNVQLVSNDDLILETEGDIEAKFKEIGTASGAGVRVGPLLPASGAASGSGAPLFSFSKSLGSFIPVAHAAAPIVIAGKMTVATPPPGVKRLVILAFPDATELAISDFELTGPDGRKGADDKGANCQAVGKDGEDAFRFTAVAPSLKVNNFTLNLGSGGAGGDAETKADCDSARAEGGKGGDSGNFKMIGANSFEIVGSFLVNPGNGGAGGGAKAVGKDGAANEKGGDATAIGGRGADNKKVMSMQGTVAGAANIQVGDLVAGGGGWASATGGKGGDADACGKAGAPGGKGSATGGKGGDARLTLGGGATRAALASDIGGTGGGVDSSGGMGGKGGDCGPDKKGGNGGTGGAAFATEGKGGSGLNGNASDGANLAEDGGSGGNGGDGCTEGKGGKGGAGDPKGADGADGKNLCVVEEAKTEVQVGGGGGTTGGSTGGANDGSGGGTQSSETIKVVRYQGKYLPVSQLIIEDEVGCGAEHWHAAMGSVTATDGTVVYDPGPQCGYGKVKDNPVMDLKIQMNFRIQ